MNSNDRLWATVLRVIGYPQFRGKFPHKAGFPQRCCTYLSTRWRISAPNVETTSLEVVGKCRLVLTSALSNTLREFLDVVVGFPLFFHQALDLFVRVHDCRVVTTTECFANLGKRQVG